MATLPNPRRPPGAIPFPPSSLVPSNRANATLALLRRHYPPPLQNQVVYRVEFLCIFCQRRSLYDERISKEEQGRRRPLWIVGGSG